MRERANEKGLGKTEAQPMMKTPPPGPVIRIAADGGDAGHVPREAPCGIP
jgi:hypothetical protein